MSRWTKVVLWTVVVAAVVVLLFTVVFPRVERVLDDPTLGTAEPGAATHGGVAVAASRATGRPDGRLRRQAERSAR